MVRVRTPVVLIVCIVAMVGAVISGVFASVIDFALTLAIFYVLLLGWFCQDLVQWIGSIT
jgi:uncharacterized membrane protein YfcA